MKNNSSKCCKKEVVCDLCTGCWSEAEILSIFVQKKGPAQDTYIDKIIKDAGL